MKADRIAQLVRTQGQTPLLPQVDPSPQPQREKALAVRLSTSMPAAEAERIEVMAREHAMTSGEKPSQSELVRAGLELLANMKVPEREAVLARLMKLKRGPTGS